MATHSRRVFGETMSEDEPTDDGDVGPDSENANPPREPYSPEKLGNSLWGRYRHRDEVEIGGETYTQETINDLRRLKEERSEETSRLMRSAASETGFTILDGILRDGPTGYEDLVEHTGRNRTTVENHIYKLRDAGVVKVVGKPAEIVFTDEDVRLIASDVLYLLS